MAAVGELVTRRFDGDAVGDSVVTANGDAVGDWVAVTADGDAVGDEVTTVDGENAVGDWVIAAGGVIVGDWVIAADGDALTSSRSAWASQEHRPVDSGKTSSCAIIPKSS